MLTIGPEILMDLSKWPLIIEFGDGEVAKKFHQDSGGWLFQPLDKDNNPWGNLVWFHPQMTPSQMMRHPILLGVSGKFLRRPE